MGLTTLNSGIFYDIDFAKLYINARQNLKTNEEKQKIWDKRAPSFLRPQKSVYTKEILKRISLNKDDEVLDFGCGPRSLALEITPFVKSVLGCDLSSVMLKELDKNAKNLGIKNIKTMQKAFEDSFDDLPKFDVIIASRSLSVMDLKATLLKLISKAKNNLSNLSSWRVFFQ